MIGMNSAQHAEQQRQRIRRQVDCEHRHLTIETEQCPGERFRRESLTNDGERHYRRARRVVAALETGDQIPVVEDEHGSGGVADEGHGDPVVIVTES